MSTYSLSLTFHVKTDRAIDGAAGLEVPRFFADLVGAAGYCTLEMSPTASVAERKAAIEAAVHDLVRRMPDGLRRGFVVRTSADNAHVEHSRWDPVTKTWREDLTGHSLVFPLELDSPEAAGQLRFSYAGAGAGEFGVAAFHLAVHAREI